ncbi:Hypothetical predicted protein, partial [Podarcis lilfordi]
MPSANDRDSHIQETQANQVQHLERAKADYKVQAGRRHQQGPAFQINPVAYKLEIPPSLKIHQVFHVSQLKPCHADYFLGRIAPPPPLVQVDGHEEFQVTQVQDLKRLHDRLHYLIDW